MLHPAADDKNWHQSEHQTTHSLAAPEDTTCYTLRGHRPAWRLPACRACCLSLPWHPPQSHACIPALRFPALPAADRQPPLVPGEPPPLQAARLVRQFRGHGAGITDMQVSEDCRWLLSASLDGTVRCWDIPGGWEVLSVPCGLPAFSACGLIGQGQPCWLGEPSGLPSVPCVLCPSCAVCAMPLARLRPVHCMLLPCLGKDGFVSFV